MKSQIWSHLLKKHLMGNCIFFAVLKISLQIPWIWRSCREKLPEVVLQNDSGTFIQPWIYKKTLIMESCYSKVASCRPQTAFLHLKHDFIVGVFHLFWQKFSEQLCCRSPVFLSWINFLAFFTTFLA